MTETLLSFPTFVALTVALVKVIGQLLSLTSLSLRVRKRLLPIFALALGVVFSMILGTTAENVIQGLIVGLSAMGLWSGGKTMVNG